MFPSISFITLSIGISVSISSSSSMSESSEHSGLGFFLELLFVYNPCVVNVEPGFSFLILGIINVLGESFRRGVITKLESILLLIPLDSASLNC